MTISKGGVGLWGVGIQGEFIVHKRWRKKKIRPNKTCDKTIPFQENVN
jgi:hypothetical protein